MNFLKSLIKFVISTQIISYVKCLIEYTPQNQICYKKFDLFITLFLLKIFYIICMIFITFLVGMQLSSSFS